VRTLFRELLEALDAGDDERAADLLEQLVELVNRRPFRRRLGVVWSR
jgi:DNA-binding GntR family transcriptional regulator